MKNSFNKLLDKMVGWGESLFLMLPNILLAALVALGVFFLVRVTRKVSLKLMNRTTDNKAVNRLAANIIAIVVAFLGLFLVLSILDLSKTVTSLLAGAGVVGLAIGLAFQDPILNVLSGVIMSVRKPFRIGDTIETNGYFGTVESITLRSIRLKKFTGEDVIIPNKMTIQNPIENYTHTQYRRVDIEVGVSYNDDLENAAKVASDAIKNNVDHEDSKEIEVFYHEFGGSSINFTLRFWLNMAEQKNYLKSQSEAIIAVKKAFDNEGITIPFPIRTLEFTNKLKLQSDAENTKNNNSSSKTETSNKQEGSNRNQENKEVDNDNFSNK